MAGRYGTDKLNTVILWTGVILMLISMFLEGWGYFILWLLSYVCMGWALYRAFSRQTYKRYQENRRFLMLLDRLRPHLPFHGGLLPHRRHQVHPRLYDEVLH